MAKKCRMKSIGVMYGYGSNNEIINSKSNMIANNINDSCMLLERLEKCNEKN